jgi:hypothetical protein
MLQRISGDIKASSMHSNENSLVPYKTSGVMVLYGGRKDSSYHADCWALDLTWRLPGVDGYDNSVSERTSKLLVSLDSAAPLSAMLHSHSTSSLHQPISYAGTSALIEEALIGTAIHRERRQRAFADVHVAREREKAEDAQARCTMLSAQVASLLEHIKTIEGATQEEHRLLLAAIEEGKSRERKLVALFEEAQKLLRLVGVNQILQE